MNERDVSVDSFTWLLGAAAIIGFGVLFYLRRQQSLTISDKDLDRDYGVENDRITAEGMGPLSS